MANYYKEFVGLFEVEFRTVPMEKISAMNHYLIYRYYHINM
jgi:hypothetical protein